LRRDRDAKRDPDSKIACAKDGLFIYLFSYICKVLMPNDDWWGIINQAIMCYNKLKVLTQSGIRSGKLEPMHSMLHCDHLTNQQTFHYLFADIKPCWKEMRIDSLYKRSVN